MPSSSSSSNTVLGTWYVPPGYFSWALLSQVFSWRWRFHISFQYLPQWEQKDDFEYGTPGEIFIYEKWFSCKFKYICLSTGGVSGGYVWLLSRVFLPHHLLRRVSESGQGWWLGYWLHIVFPTRPVHLSWHHEISFFLTQRRGTVDNTTGYLSPDS